MDIANINIGKLKYARDDPELAGWRDNIAEMFRLAESSRGFVWRLTGDEGQYTGIRLFNDSTIVTQMSVWKSIEDFKDYVYRSMHKEFVAQRTEWFEPIEPHFALWWVEPGHIPSLQEGKLKLDLLRDYGPTQESFTPARSFAAPIQPVPIQDSQRRTAT
jgi:Domain of unknown function (DUF3291)